MKYHGLTFILVDGYEVGLTSKEICHAHNICKDRDEAYYRLGEYKKDAIDDAVENFGHIIPKEEIEDIAFFLSNPQELWERCVKLSKERGKLSAV